MGDGGDAPSGGSYTSYVTVDDLNGGTTTVSFNWTVTDTNHPPYLYHWDYFYTRVGDSVLLEEFNAEDIDLGDTLVFDVVDLPPGLWFDPELNRIAGTTTTAGTYGVTCSVSDGQGGSDSDTCR